MLFVITKRCWGSPRDIVANVRNCDIVMSEFERRSCNYVHFRTNTLLCPTPDMGQILIRLFTMIALH